MGKQFKFRIYPSKEQEARIQKNFGCARFVYNYFLGKRIEAYKSGQKMMSLNECARNLTLLKKQEGYEWLAEADDNSLRYALRDLEFAYKSFFRSVNHAGFPKFKGKRETRRSYRSKNNIARQSIAVYDNEIKLPKLGLVTCKVSRQIDGRILFATISQVPSGKYFVSVCCTEFEPVPLIKTEAEAGIHMGIKTLVSLSDGRRFKNVRAFEKSRAKIGRLQRRLSRKSKDSKNHEKARLKLARAYEKVTNQRNDFLHKLTSQLVNEYDLICVREEPFSERAKNTHYSKYAADAGFGTFVRQLEYKCNWYGKDLIKISNWHPSVQLCSYCGHKNLALKLRNSSAKWTCPNCGEQHNRAVNAAVNILNEAKRVRRDKPEVKPDESA